MYCFPPVLVLKGLLVLRGALYFKINGDLYVNGNLPVSWLRASGEGGWLICTKMLAAEWMVLDKFEIYKIEKNKNIYILWDILINLFL